MSSTQEVKLYNGFPITIVKKKSDGIYHWAIPEGGKWDSSSRKFVDSYFKNKNRKYIIVNDKGTTVYED